MAKTLEVEERFALGQKRRKQMRRTVHAEWKASERREDPLKLLAASMRGRVPALVTLKYERMALSPFGYFRGAVPVMAYDLSLVGNTGILSQLCGDAHVQNLGAYAGPDGRLVFDINDFDETIVGPFEWDVKRMATSLILAGREAGVKSAHCSDAAAVFLERYRYCITAFARMPLLGMARYQVHRLKDVSPVEGILRMAERATPMHTLLELTEREKAKRTAHQQSSHPSRVFKTMAPVLTRVQGREASRVVASAYAPYIGRVNGGKGLSNHRGRYHQGRRVVEGERAMQMQSDPFLGWTTIDGREYMVRQLNDHKASIQVTDLKAGLLEYASVCGELLARGHARSGDCLMLGGYLGKSARFDEAVVKFAEAYENQTEKDWHELVQSMKKTGKHSAKKPEAKATKRLRAQR